MKKEYLKPTWQIKNLSESQKNLLIEELIQNYIYLENTVSYLDDKANKISEKLERANDFIEIMINKLKFIDIKKRDNNVLDEIIKECYAQIN